uniref:uncharacterized protein n=1 Tax=Centroberyx gerrardi TaxID=166262 RepID=UPI003AAD90FF
MKLPQESEDAKINRKLLKPQVERRRRERMNRSLESLKALLLQGPQQQEPTQRRVEKAEILEHTVVFLHNTAEGDGRRAGGGGQQHSFQDGFSTCLQRAAQFLGPEGKGLRLGAALDATFAARFARSDSVGVKAAAKARSSSSLPHMKSSQFSPQTMMQKSKHRLYVRAFSMKSLPHSHQLPVQLGYPRAPQQPQRPNQLEIRVERRASGQTQSQSAPGSQSLWRPWP